MVGTRGTSKQYMCNVCAILTQSLKGRHHLRHLGVDWRIILKWSVNMWTVWVPLKAWNLLTSSATFSFPSRALLQGVREEVFLFKSLLYYSNSCI